ncbi:MAG: hypothetical protein HYZ35_07875 [Chloroflexi bacterium]|nr:hypothetical protein [Chloroflexota bacterium]
MGLIIVLEILLHAPQILAIEYGVILVQQYYQRVCRDALGECGMLHDVAIELGKQFVVFFFK